MKRLPFTFFILMLFVYTAMGQNVGFNDNNSEPKASAMLDVFSTTKGMLIPRIALTTTTSASPVTSPETSLLVYNTATVSDVKPGYYYWNGTIWVRLETSADQEINYSLFIKSANATLLKTETMIVASGDIILTLPAVTSDDDGLEIVVKNAGTYTDLVVIKPEAGKKIDANDSSRLTRWSSRIYLAYGSNWIVKNKDPRAENLLDVSSTGSFNTIAEVVAFLNEHMAGPTMVRIGGGTHPVDATQTIDLPYPVTFQGLSYGESAIVGTAGVAGSPLFECATECYFKMLMFEPYDNGLGNDAIHLTGAEEYYEVKDSYFKGFDKAIVQSSNSEVWLFECTIENCASAGLEIAAGSASGGVSNISESDFLQCAKGISMLSGSAWTIGISNGNFYNTPAGTDIGIYYSPASFTNFTSMIISNNGYNNQGTFISGFDFTRTDGRDVNAFIDSNHGTESKMPHFNINVMNNTSTVTLTNANQWYKCTWTNTTTYPSSWLIVNNKCTYLPLNKRDVIMWISGSISANNTNRTLTVCVVKNGVSTVRYGEMKFRTPATVSQPTQFSTIVYLTDVSPGDYFELYISTSTAGDIVRVWDLAWFSNSQ
jgi:hypothetical protein